MADLAIFYDLETSDQHPIGQIMNFSFICVDRNFKITDEYSDQILLNRLQLPGPGAILANRIDVLKHQKESKETEKSAALKIAKFIDKQIQIGKKVVFVGYNSSKFDLPFLRTTLIRNGINPYFFGALVYKDLLFAARKLSVSNPDFPRLESRSKKAGRGEEAPRVSLSLETLTNHFGLLEGKQAHSSREDVVITIELAKLFAEKFKLNVFDYEPYEVSALHTGSRQGKVYNSFYVNYEIPGSSHFTSTPMTLLDADHRYSLWIDLKKYGEGQGRKSISWFSQQASSFFSDKKEIADPSAGELAKKALLEFKDLSLKNYFEISSCDIEQDIYRLDMSMINSLFEVIWKNQIGSKSNFTKDAKIISLRHDLANYEWGNKSDKQVEDLFRQYALYRYGGKLRMNKFRDVPEPGKEIVDSYHVTLNELMRLCESPENNSNPEDKKLMKSLKDFYLKSDVYRLCMDKLEIAA